MIDSGVEILQVPELCRAMDEFPHPWLRRGRIKPPARLALPAQQCTSLQYAHVLWAVLTITLLHLSLDLLTMCMMYCVSKTPIVMVTREGSAMLRLFKSHIFFFLILALSSTSLISDPV